MKKQTYFCVFYDPMTVLKPRLKLKNANFTGTRWNHAVNGGIKCLNCDTVKNISPNWKNVHASVLL